MRLKAWIERDRSHYTYRRSRAGDAAERAYADRLGGGPEAAPIFQRELLARVRLVQAMGGHKDTPAALHAAGWRVVDAGNTNAALNARSETCIDGNRTASAVPKITRPRHSDLPGCGATGKECYRDQHHSDGRRWIVF